MENYKNVVNHLINNTSVRIDEVFDYEFSPLKDEFDFLFEFYSETLSKNAHYGIVPSFLYYGNYYSVNAYATKKKEAYIICINMGTIYNLIQRFKINKDLLIDTKNEEFIEFEKTIDTPIHELMYQNAIHFTFYHEMAHLVQKSELLNNKLYEINDTTNKYSLRKHLYELDADKFSSLFLGSHIVYYLKKHFGLEITKNQFEKALIIICSSTLFYMLSFKSNKVKIYYEENSHPHPIIRITNIIFHTIDYCLQSLEQSGLKIDIVVNDVVNRCLVFSNNIAKYKFKENYIEEYFEIVRLEASEIINYTAKMRELEKDDTTLAAYKWNLWVNELKSR